MHRIRDILHSELEVTSLPTEFMALFSPACVLLLRWCHASWGFLRLLCFSSFLVTPNQAQTHEPSDGRERNQPQSFTSATKKLNTHSFVSLPCLYCHAFHYLLLWLILPLF